MSSTTDQPNTDRQQLGQLLRRMRQEAGKTHADLMAAGIASRSKMSMIESGRTRVRAADIYAFSALYQLTAEQTTQLLAMADPAQPSDTASPSTACGDVNADDKIAYQRDAVPVGPFAEMPPLDLWRLLSSGGTRSGGEVRERARTWLASALHDAGVALGEYDHHVIGLLADDCATTVQVVAGWIVQARRRKPRATPADPPAVR